MSRADREAILETWDHLVVLFDRGEDSADWLFAVGTLQRYALQSGAGRLASPWTVAHGGRS